MNNNCHLSCPVCYSIKPGKEYVVREMMQGTRHKFQYMECPDCGTLRLMDPPADMAPYYRDDYYSISHRPEIWFRPYIKRWLKSIRDFHVITGRLIPGGWINRFMPAQNLELYHLRKLMLRKQHRILDVGSGAGMLTYIFYNAGFKNIHGIDPHIPATIQYKNGLTIEKKELGNVEVGNWDIIFFHHSFEHLPDPYRTLEQVYRLLKPGGACILRLPTVSSYAWEYYRENWVQLDAPRHFFLYSIKGLQVLAANAGFSFEYLADEGTILQFTGSEQYKMDIPLRGDKRSFIDGNHALFRRQRLAAFEQQAVELNQQRRGDCISVMLTKESR